MTEVRGQMAEGPSSLWRASVFVKTTPDKSVFAQASVFAKASVSAKASVFAKATPDKTPDKTPDEAADKWTGIRLRIRRMRPPKS